MRLRLWILALMTAACGQVLPQSNETDLTSLWCVGTDYNVGKWNTAADRWDNLGNLGGWTLLSIAFDANGTLWCVGTEHNVGKWDPAKNGWDDLGNLGGWILLSIAFDSSGALWCVGTGNNVGKWDSTLNGWIDQGKVGGWMLLDVAFSTGSDKRNARLEDVRRAFDAVSQSGDSTRRSL